MSLPSAFFKTPQYLKKFYKSLSQEVWAVLALSTLSVIILANFVDLQPKIDDKFFFASDDPQFQSEHRISELFVRNDTQLIISATGDIESERYLNKLEVLSDTLLKVEGITGVNSLTHGPSSFKDAIKSPLWKRLVISDDLKSTNLIVLLEETEAPKIVPYIEVIIEQFNSDDFQLRAAGLPYVLELIKRNLVRDLKLFSLLAFLIFGVFIFLIFRSKAVLCGTLIACLDACVWTLMITDLKQVPIGILTANLATIIFVLTLSHIIFLTYSWRKVVAETDLEKSVEKAIERTFPASFWSMMTTLLGFLSLLTVQAKPLNDLGTSGSIGTIVALLVAYGVFPPFLKMASHPSLKPKSSFYSLQSRAYSHLENHRKYVALVICICCLLAAPGIMMVDSDPSLLSYFSKKSEMFKGFDYIDRNGGSSPLIVVVRYQDDDKLNTGDAYKDLWELQESLELHRSVGSVISLPVLMAQAKKSPLAFFVTWEWLLDILEQPQYDEIAKSFVTEDRQYGLFLLRMNESHRVESRLDVVEEIEEIVEARGFIPEILGGVYILQGHLAKLVFQSLVIGLLKLILLFAVIAWLISRSIHIALTMTISISLIPLCVLGLIGIYRIPLDIIAAPASNVAIAIGIDSMIHMIKDYRRHKSWRRVKDNLWQPILTSMVVVSTGFAIFLASTFPPTQRFGLAIVFGTMLAALTALFIMPLIFDFIAPQRLRKLFHLKRISALSHE